MVPPLKMHHCQSHTPPIWGGLLLCGPELLCTGMGYYLHSRFTQVFPLNITGACRHQHIKMNEYYLHTWLSFAARTASCLMLPTGPQQLVVFDIW